MKIDKMYLEITRNCTLECEHCLRGNKEIKDMDILTLENSLKDVNEINTLLLTGGEPLLNIKLLNELPNIIDKNKIVINNISIITNGTVASLNHVNVLKTLSNKCNSFNLILSSDLFHRLEWSRLNINDKVENNYKYYQQFFPMYKYLDDDSNHSILLLSTGRAKRLSKERLNELERKYFIKYKLMTELEQNFIKKKGNNIYGKLCINVYGNVIPYDISFSEEDNCYNTDLNVNCLSLETILDNIDNKELHTYTRKRIKSVN